jgi:hypothetical protein
VKKSIVACLIISITLTGCGTFIEELVDRYNYDEPINITFINDSDYDISIRGFGVRKQLNRRYYEGSILVPRKITSELPEGCDLPP